MVKGLLQWSPISPSGGFSTASLERIMWQPVTSSADAENLMRVFGRFHDSCIRELHVWGKYFVAPDLTMACPDTPDFSCRLFIQRQAANPAAVELLFTGVSHLSVVASPGYDRIIMEATLLVEDGKLTWSPDNDFDSAKYDFGMSSAIVATKLWWRPIEGGLGLSPSYGRPAELPNDAAL